MATSTSASRRPDHLLERSAECEALERLLAAARAVPGRGVLIEGPPGVGKTALLDYARGRAERDRVVLRAKCTSLERTFAFGVVRQLFEPIVMAWSEEERVVAFRGAAAPARRLFVGVHEEEVLAPPTTSAQMIVHGLYWLVVSLCDRGPLALFVDDAHNADESSLLFMAYLAGRVEDLPVCMAMAARRESGELAYGRFARSLVAETTLSVVRPQALSESAVRRVVRSRFGPQADDEFCHACYVATGGNPLYVHEVIAALKEDAVEAADADAQHLAHVAPGAVADVIAHRMDRLDTQARILLQAAAVVERGGDRRLAAVVLGLDDETAQRAFNALVAADFLEPGAGLAFRHPVVQSAVYETIPPVTRGELHSAAADEFRVSGAPAELVSSHLLAAPPAGDAGRVETLTRAAAEARRRGVPEVAALYLERALNEPPAADIHGELLRQLGNCEAYTLRFATAEQHLREAAARAASTGHQALAAFSLARFLTSVGRSNEGAVILIGAEKLEGVPSDIRARIAAALLGVAVYTIDLRALVEQRLQGFRELARQSQEWPRYEAFLLAHEALGHAFRGDATADEVASAAARAFATGQLRPDQSAYWLAIHAMLTAGDLRHAEQWIEVGRREARHSGLLLVMPILDAYMARIATARGDLAEAEECLEAGSKHLTERHFAEPLLEAGRVQLLLIHGDVKQAAEQLETSAAERIPDTAFNLPLLAARGDLAFATGQYAAAVDAFLLLGTLYQRWGADSLLDYPWRSRAARAYAALGNRQRAEEFAVEELRLAERFRARPALGVALRGVGAVVETDDAFAYMERSAHMLREAQAPLELAQTLYEHGALLVDRRRRPEGRVLLREAIELASSIGARGLIKQAAATMTAGGGRRPKLRATGVHALTSSERRIAILAARGLSNRDIAQELFVTEKTVEAHLSRVYRKLEIRSRWQLSTTLESLGVPVTED